MHLAYSPLVLALLVVIAFLGGTAKGLAGFGGALVMAPLCGMVVAPGDVTALIVFVHCATSLQGVRTWSGGVQWRVVGPFAATAVLFILLSGLALRGTHPATIRHIVALCVLGVTALHMRGWRWRHDGTWVPTLVAGAVSGALTTLGGLGGPPAFYYLNGLSQGSNVRGNLLGYFALLFGASTVIILCERGAPMSNGVTAALLVPAFAGGVALGERIARGMSPRWMARLVCLLLTASGLAALCS